MARRCLCVEWRGVGGSFECVHACQCMQVKLDFTKDPVSPARSLARSLSPSLAVSLPHSLSRSTLCNQEWTSKMTLSLALSLSSFLSLFHTLSHKLSLTRPRESVCVCTYWVKTRASSCRVCSSSIIYMKHYSCICAMTHPYVP